MVDLHAESVRQNISATEKNNIHRRIPHAFSVPSETGPSSPGGASRREACPGLTCRAPSVRRNVCEAHHGRGADIRQIARFVFASPT